MKRSIIKMKFKTPIHIGNKNLSDSEFEIMADTIFSALCLESDNIPELVNKAKKGEFKISNAFPYIDEFYYIPKPMVYVEHKSEDYKLFKKIKYIAYDTLDFYFKGSLIPKEELECFILGDSDIRTQVCVGSDPFQVGTYTFKDNAGLYIIVEHKDDEIFKLFERLQYSGIGGKRSSGLGRFTFEIKDCFEFPEGNKKILLNTAMAKDSELDGVLDGANYLLQKRSGFIYQSRYKKRDFYSFKAGSVYENEFTGDIFDVGNDEHPVYRYAIPMFLEVNT
ncbi:MAG: type III-A CRISPR-associated RAMP protein Csm4 [Clostridiales bacterium]|nr:type III-A CRISPR-associated RAMP protein Csm4 [Clostridiales bacterium]